MHHRYALAIAMLSVIALTACASAVTDADTQHQRQGDAAVETPAGPQTRIIIKFRESTANVTQAGFMATLSRDAGVPLEYLRPMSGGAHVLRASRPLRADEIADAIKRLSSRPDVVYVEPDRMMRHQPRKQY